MSDTIIGWVLVGWLFGGPRGNRAPRRSAREGEPSHSPSAPQPQSIRIGRPETQARDTLLIARIRHDDATAVDELMCQYAQPLADIALSIVGSIDLAQDVVQDVFYTIWDTRHRITIRTSVVAYLTRAVRNRALNLVRDERAERTLSMDTLSSDPNVSRLAVANDGPAQISSTEFRFALSNALASLQARTREVFLLRADLGMSYAEISEALQIAVPTVHNLMYRATKTLALQLAEWRDLLDWET